MRLDRAVHERFLDDDIAGRFHIENFIDSSHIMVRELCSQYPDSEIGFVDAAVLAVVERLNEPKLATIDRRHFRMLRPRHVEVLGLLPALRTAPTDALFNRRPSLDRTR